MAPTRTKTPTARNTATRKPVAKPGTKAPLPKTRSAAAVAQKAVVVEETKPVSEQLELRKAELIELVVERSGVKKRDAKPAIEAALAILGETLAEGREMNLRPFGKMKVMRMKQLSNATVMNCKVRQVQKTEEDSAPPLAEAAE